MDLLFLDPPYNLDKSFNGRRFARRSVDDYTCLARGCAVEIAAKAEANCLRRHPAVTGSSSASIFAAASKHLIVRNRRDMEREEGPVPSANWKNSSEDIWFCTVADDYTFNLDAVRLRRRVLAPYTHGDGAPKDWQRDDTGGHRDTCPSNFWSDITVPFWSMPENTDHPTQKSEKLVAKLLLASTNAWRSGPGPVLGKRNYLRRRQEAWAAIPGVEIDEEYCRRTERRLEIAAEVTSIQGFADGVFWERNSQPPRPSASPAQLAFDGE